MNPEIVRVDGAAALRDDVRDEPAIARRVLADRGRGRRDVRMLGDHRLDLTELDAEATDLDLVVDPAEIEQLTGDRVAPCHPSDRARRRRRDSDGTAPP